MRARQSAMFQQQGSDGRKAPESKGKGDTQQMRKQIAFCARVENS